MYRKPFQIKTQSKVRSSDRRKLRSTLLDHFPALRSPEQEALLDAALGNANNADNAGSGTGQLVAIKLETHGGDTVVVYEVDGNPVVFKDIDGNIFPTAEKLKKCLQAVYYNLATSDLMLPGVIVPDGGFGHFNSGDMVAVVGRGSPYPMAVGTMLVSSDQIKEDQYAMRGKGVKIVHVLGDYLWAHGDKSGPPESAAPTTDEEPSNAPSTTDADATEPANDTPAMSDITQSLEGSSLSDNPSPDTPAPLTPAEMDELLLTAFLTSLKLKLPDDPKLFPMSATVLYSSYILPSRPVGTVLDVKGSTYKKVAKFLKAMEKKGIVKLKERNGDIVIMSVNRQHPMIQTFDPPRKVAGDVKPKPSAPGGLAGSSGTNASPASDAKPGVMSCTELYKGTSKIATLFEQIGLSKDSLFTATEIRNALNEYAQSKELVDKANPRLVKIDPYLCDAVLEKDEYNSIDVLPRDVITQRLIAKMQPFHELTLPGRDPEVRKGQLNPIHVTVDKPRNGTKVVTKITGVEAYGIDPKDLAARLKVPCASSTSVSPLPGKSNTQEVMVQGPKHKEVFTCLETAYGVPFKGSGGANATSKFVVLSMNVRTK
ncbi:Eukaryotic translation initiation factor 2D [Borealophlyctis nickersoniae]|nr:Eukaryotic translation initiation factor 2D [Borealophlyctis nickersoniae]